MKNHRIEGPGLGSLTDDAGSKPVGAFGEVAPDYFSQGYSGHTGKWKGSRCFKLDRLLTQPSWGQTPARMAKKVPRLQCWYRSWSPYWRRSSFGCNRRGQG